MKSSIEQLIFDLFKRLGKLPHTAYLCENNGKFAVLKNLEEASEFLGITYKTIRTYVNRNYYNLKKNRSFKKINPLEIIKKGV